MSLFRKVRHIIGTKLNTSMHSCHTMLAAQIDIALPFQMASHMIASAVHSRFEVQAVDGGNISVVFTVKLLPIATLDPCCPNLMHLSHHHHHHHFHPQQHNEESKTIKGYVCSVGYVPYR